MYELSLDNVYKEIETCLGKQDIDGAEALCLPAGDQFPKDPQLLFYAAHILVQRDKYFLALLAIKESIALHPTGRAYGNLGAIYRRMNNHPEAMKALQKSIEYEPNEKNAWNNMAANFVNEGNPYPGIKAANKALEIDPEFVKGRWNLGLLELEAGMFEEGWKNYRAGLALSDRMLRSYSQGDGGFPMVESLAQLTEFHVEQEKLPRVIVWGEQGIGDEIMFSTMLQDFSEFADIIFECHPRLIGMFERSYPFIKEFHPTRKDDHLEWPLAEEWEGADFKCAIGDLGLLLRRSRESFDVATKDQTPWLKSDPVLTQQYRETLEEIAPGKRYVGVSWTGGVLRTMRWYRSIELKELAALANDPEICLVSLQYEDDAAAIEAFTAKTGVHVLRFPAITQAYNYDHTLALVMALDEVVTVCQSVAHLSASAGQVTRVLVPDKPAWRYGLKGSDWFWYGENAKLYRREGTEWDDALVQLYEDMEIGPLPLWEAQLMKDVCKPGDRMLELGCKGFGSYKEWFASKGVDHVSVDLNGEGGALAMDLQKPLGLGEFDVVTNFGTTEHVDEQEPTWRNVHDAVKPGGTLVSTTPFPGDWSHHGRWYPDAFWYAEFCNLNGYTVEHLGISGSEPRRMICLKAHKLGDPSVPFTMPAVEIYENEDERRKTGAYI